MKNFTSSKIAKIIRRCNTARKNAALSAKAQRNIIDMFGIATVAVADDEPEQTFTLDASEIATFASLQKIQAEIHEAIRPVLTARRKAEHAVFQFEFMVTQVELNKWLHRDAAIRKCAERKQGVNQAVAVA